MATRQPASTAGMTRSSTVLLLAWSLSLLAVGGIALYLQFSYEPPPPQTPTTDQPTSDQPVSDTQLPEAAASDTPIDGVTEAPGEAVEDGLADLTDQQTQDPVDNQTDQGPAMPEPGPIDEERPVRPLVLSPATDPALVENGPYGPMPIIGAGGREPWQVYARPTSLPDDAPRIAIIITNVGLSSRLSSRAISDLPPAVTLALSPYSSEPGEWASRARNAGHETLLMVPTEPMDYPDNDPGPHTLLADGPAAANLDRLAYLLSRMTGYVGVINHMGSRFTAKRDALDPLMTDLARRGLMFVDARSTRFSVAAAAARDYGVPRASNTRYIDNVQDGAEIDRQLQELQNVAQTLGAAVGVGRPFPITMDRLSAWAQDLEEVGIALVPVSAIANRQMVQ